MRVSHLLCFVAVWVCTLDAGAVSRVFVNQQGLTLEGEIVTSDKSSVKVRRSSDGQEVTLQLAALCAEDRKFIAQLNGPIIGSNAMPTPPSTPRVTTTKANTPEPKTGSALVQAVGESKFSLEVEVQTKKSDRPTGSYVDDRRMKLSMKAVVKSREVKRAFEGGTGTLVIIGRDVAIRDRYEVLQKESFTVDVPAQGAFEHATPEIQLVYDNIIYKSGMKYQGFIFTVQDASGQLQIVEASPADYVKLAEKSLGLKVGQSVDRQLMPMNIVR